MNTEERDLFEPSEADRIVSLQYELSTQKAIKSDLYAELAENAKALELFDKRVEVLHAENRALQGQALSASRRVLELQEDLDGVRREIESHASAWSHSTVEGATHVRYVLRTLLDRDVVGPDGKGQLMSTYSIIRNRPYYKGVKRDLSSPQRGDLVYEEGKIVTADGLNDDPHTDCGQGINFCDSIAKALKWGPLVVEVTPRGKVIDAGGKLRAKSVKVGKVVDLCGATLSMANLSWADLSGADLSGANLSGANLSGADLSGAYGTPLSGVPDGWVLVDGFWQKEETN